MVVKSRNQSFSSPSSHPPRTPSPTPPSSHPRRLTSPSQTSRNQVLRRNAASLNEEADKALVSYLLSPSRNTKFSQACKRRQDLFGAPNSTERKVVKDRHQQLKKLQQQDNQAFLNLVYEYDLGDKLPLIPPVQEEEQDRPTLEPEPPTPEAVSFDPRTPSFKKRVLKPPSVRTTTPVSTPVSTMSDCKWTALLNCFYSVFLFLTCLVASFITRRRGNRSRLRVFRE
jgi:hypothetical protein